MSIEAREERLIETLRQIAGIARCCVVQRVPSDDKIIAEHIEEISDMAEAAIKDAITAARLSDPTSGPDEQRTWYDTSGELQ